MSIRQFVPPQSLSDMREAGRSLDDKALFEIDLSSGAITWVNQFVLNKLGYGMEQIRALTIYDLIPEEFHDEINDEVSDKSTGKSRKFSFWPIKNSSGQLVWWYLYKTKIEFPTCWSHAELVQITRHEGPEYTFMRVTMDNASIFNSLQSRVDELDKWIHNKVHTLEVADAGFHKLINDISDKMKHVMNAATSAANTSLEVAAAVKNLKGDVQDTVGKHEEEILKLISTDVHHDRRIEAFEKHVKATTDKAIQSITTQANTAGKGLSRKVTIPVSAIAAIATLLQWLISHFFK